MFIKQISIYMENIKGALNEVINLLGEAGADIMALSVADTSSFGIVRVITREHEIENALKVLHDNGLVAKANNIICVCVDDKPKGLANVLGLLQKADVNIEYMYTLNKTVDGYAILVLRPTEKTKTVNLLNSQGIKTLTQAQVNEL